MGKQLDRVIITHYDNDHIQSAGRLIKENGKFSEPKIIPIKQVWLNIFQHLHDIPQKVAELSDEDQQHLTEFMAEHSEFTGINDEEEYEINAEQAVFLGKELLAKGYPWNDDFRGKAVCMENGRKVLVKDTVRLWIPSAADPHQKP